VPHRGQAQAEVEPIEDEIEAALDAPAFPDVRGQLEVPDEDSASPKARAAAASAAPDSTNRLSVSP
jgi:hypothetical protein